MVGISLVQISNYHLIWSAFALFLARRTEFAINTGHFLIILPFHSILATFQVSISLIFDLFRSHCFEWSRSKEVLVRVSFRFTSCHFSISFPKLTIFTILRLYMACKMWKITALTWEMSSWRLVEKFSAFPMYYSLYNWIGEHEIKKLKNNYLYICFESRKKDTKTSTKRHEWNGMTQNGSFDIFSNAHA